MAHITKYHSRVFLNPINSDSTSTLDIYDGIVTSEDEKTWVSRFVEISDCKNKIRLHQTSDDSDKIYIQKLKYLVDELNLFINHLEK